MKNPSDAGPRAFATTNWSLVGAARLDPAGLPRAERAMEELCEAYWYPLYAFVRSRGHSAGDAQDLTQSFLTRFIETGGFAAAHPDRGRFRSYLLGAMKHFLANEWHRNQAQKRGGGVQFVALDALDPEARYALEPTQSPDPDARFDREWARAVVDRAMDRLRAESESKGRGDLYQATRGCLVGESVDLTETAARLNMTPGALKVAIHRLRRRYRELLRNEIAETVNHPSEIDDEMRYLLAVLREQS